MSTDYVWRRAGAGVAHMPRGQDASLRLLLVDDGAEAVSLRLLKAVAREIETIALFAAASASLVNAAADGHARFRGIVDLIPASLPPEARSLTACLPGILGSDLPSGLRARLQELPVRLALARTMAMTITESKVGRASLEAASDCWRKLCHHLLEVVREMRALSAEQTHVTADSGERVINPSTERLLAAAALGGSPCIGPDGTVEVPGWLERRAVPRVLANVPGILHVAGNSQTVTVRDLSRTGAGIEHVSRLEPRTVCALTIGTRTLKGLVVWSGEDRCGVMFNTPLVDVEQILAPLGRHGIGTPMT